ncbi:MAG: cysteine synthase family protein [bacterium]|nr:cysteine synthase family protein [bacterium]
MKNNILKTIGNTPLVKLEHMSPNPKVEIWVKLEFFNPTGSIKDRIIKHIVEDAEKTGQLKPGGTIVENTSGNTGAAIAMIAALKGYKAILTMPDKVSKEKQKTLTALGAKIIMAPTSASPDSPSHYVNLAKKIAAEIPNSFRVNQYDNLKNTEAHYLTTGPEIWKQTKGKITHFVAAGSTGGTVSGTGKYLKEQNKKIKVLMPDPVGSLYYHYFKTGKLPLGASCSYQVEGVGEDHIAHAMDFSIVDDMYQFTDQDAFSTARSLAREEGIFGGGTGGANVWAAIKLAKTLKRPAVIVTIIPDNGIRYLSKFYDDEWMIKNNYSIK